MPLTFLAHQAPILPMKRRWPGLDGVALAVGSAVPDLASATYNLPVHYVYGRQTWFDGHTLSQVIVWCLPVGLVLTWLVRRLIAPRLVPYLPDLGAFHLRDYALVGRNRHRWWVIAGCVVVGALTHVAIDTFTHADKGTIRIEALSTHVVDVAGRSLDAGNLFQLIGTVGLSVWCVWELHRSGTRREMRTWSGLEASSGDDVGESPPPAVRSVRIMVALVVAGSALTIPAQLDRSASTAAMTAVWTVIAGLTVISLVVAAVDSLPSRRPPRASGGSTRPLGAHR